MSSSPQLALNLTQVVRNAISSPMDYRNPIESEEQIKAADHSQMKVIGAALCRTGTKSLREALNILGFNCYHMQDVVLNKQELVWIQAAEAKQSQKSHTINWNTVLSTQKDAKKYSAIVDGPGCLFYKELLEFYPNAKVILTQRDFDKWYASAQRTVWQMYRMAGCWQTRFCITPKARQFYDTAIFYKGGLPRFDGKDMEGAKAFYEKYQEEVKANVPSEQLLVYSVKEGWEPLCKFLGVDVPSVEFPHANKTGDAEEHVHFVMAVFKLMNVGIVFVAAMAYFLFVFL